MQSWIEKQELLCTGYLVWTDLALADFLVLMFFSRVCCRSYGMKNRGISGGRDKRDTEWRERVRENVPDKEKAEEMEGEKEVEKRRKGKG